MENKGSIAFKDQEGNQVKEMLFTYDEDEKLQNEINRENAKLIGYAEFIPYYVGIKRKFDLTFAETLLYGFIRHYLGSNPTGRFYYTNKELGIILCLSEDTASSAINRLKDLGIVNLNYKKRIDKSEVRYINGKDFFVNGKDEQKKLS